MKYEHLYRYLNEICSKLDNTIEKEMFRKCYLNTLETTVEY